MSNQKWNLSDFLFDNLKKWFWGLGLYMKGVRPGWGYYWGIILERGRLIHEREGEGGPTLGVWWYYTILYYTILYYTVLYCTLLYYIFTILYHSICIYHFYAFIIYYYHFLSYTYHTFLRHYLSNRHLTFLPLGHYTESNIQFKAIAGQKMWKDTFAKLAKLGPKPTNLIRKNLKKVIFEGRVGGMVVLAPLPMRIIKTFCISKKFKNR